MTHKDTLGEAAGGLDKSGTAQASGSQVDTLSPRQNSGRPRQDIRIGRRIGNFIILGRADRKYRPGKLNSEWYYRGECIVCGTICEKRICHFRQYSSHLDCPALVVYLREIARKQQPGLFNQFMRQYMGSDLELKATSQAKVNNSPPTGAEMELE